MSLNAEDILSFCMHQLVVIKPHIVCNLYAQTMRCRNRDCSRWKSSNPDDSTLMGAGGLSSACADCIFNASKSFN